MKHGSAQLGFLTSEQMFAVKCFVVSCQLKKAGKEVILLFYVVCVFRVNKSGQNTTGTPSQDAASFIHSDKETKRVSIRLNLKTPVSIQSSIDRL